MRYFFIPSMPNYAQFEEFLNNQNSSISLEFAEIEKIVGKLPKSAYEYQEWWSNHPSHPLMKVILKNGWRKKNLDLFLKKVEFFQHKVKQNTPPKKIQPSTKTTIKNSSELLREIDSLVEKKKEISQTNIKIHSNAVQLAEQYLRKIHPDIQNWETKLGSDSGVDIVGYSNNEEKIVGEVKSTIPYGGNRLGAAQATSIKHDLDKMKKYHGTSKYFFILDSITKTAVIHKFQNELDDIKVLAIKEIYS